MTCKSKPTEYLDASGLRCPLPLLRTKQALMKMAAGEVLEVVATDAGSWRDIPAYIETSHHRLLDQSEPAPGHYRYLIERGED